jgi:transcriptional regulator with XRE-family HTH domain
MQRHVEVSARDWLRGLRLRMGMTQRELADHIGVHKITVAKWETGARRLRGKYRVVLNDLARVHKYPPLAPPRKKPKRPTVTLSLPAGWRERERRES